MWLPSDIPLPDDGIRHRPLHPGAVEADEPTEEERRPGQARPRQVRRVEEREDEHGAEVVGDGERGQEDLQGGRHPAAEDAAGARTSSSAR